MKVGVRGAGRVGLASALVLCELGHDVTLFDVDSSRVRRLGASDVPFFEPDTTNALILAKRSGRWTVTDRADALAACESLLIAVPTPAGSDGQYDLTALRAAVDELMEVRTRAGSSLGWRGIFLRSTVLPGTTERIFGATLNGPAGADSRRVAVGYLPEFFREGSMLGDARQPDRIVVGTDDPELRAVARALFGNLDTKWLETGIRTAELIKTASNGLLATCISFANEIARIAETIDGVDVMEVFEGMHLDRRFHGTPRAGIVDYLRPGPGFGGSCLPKDLAALATLAGTPSLLGAASHVNRTQPTWLVERIERALGGLSGLRVLVLGLAFKPSTDDLRDSIALPLCRELVGRGAAVRAHDPTVSLAETRALLGPLGVVRIPGTTLRGEFEACEVALLVTPWPGYLEMLPAILAERSTPLLFVDTRGIFRAVTCAPSVTYLGIGTRPVRDGGSR